MCMFPTSKHSASIMEVQVSCNILNELEFIFLMKKGATFFRDLYSYTLL